MVFFEIIGFKKNYRSDHIYFSSRWVIFERFGVELFVAPVEAYGRMMFSKPATHPAIVHTLD